MSTANELFAIASHLHVVLRRKTGRVTDTEWMVCNAEYAAAMVAFARAQAASEGHAELLPLADKLEALIPSIGVVARKPLLQVAADHYLAVDQGLIPVGAPEPVAGTAFDFRLARPVGDHGFDHNFCLSDRVQPLRPVASLTAPRGDLRLVVETDAPGLQVYDGAHLNGLPGLGGRRYGPHAGIALETQGGLKNERGSIAMARTGDPDSATAQFFINVVDNTRLDTAGGGYAVFGKVIEGMDVVDKIRMVPVGNKGPFQNVPVTPVVIKQATLQEK